MKLRAIRRRRVFTITSPSGAATRTRSPLRAYVLLLWHGVYPKHAVSALSAMRDGRASALEGLFMDTEPFGVSVDWASK